jgi:hypothetical protein
VSIWAINKRTIMISIVIAAHNEVISPKFPLWAGPAEPGSVNDMTAARAHALPALYRAAALGLPVLADSLQQGRVHRRVQRRGDPLPLPRQHHTDPLDTGTSPRLMTSGQDTRSARCVETRTAGATGGPGKPTRSNPGRAPRSDPTGRFYRTELNALLRRINAYLVRWARRKYKRLQTYKKARRWWDRLLERQPAMFAH